MATPYSDIYNIFLSQIQDYDMLDDCVDVVEKDLLKYLYRALSDCQNMLLNVSGLDLSKRKRNDELQEFEEDLPDEVVNLLVMGMEYYWLVPKIQNTDNLRNIMSVGEFKQFSQGNMLGELNVTRKDAEARWKAAQRAYAQRFYGVGELTKIHEQKAN